MMFVLCWKEGVINQLQKLDINLSKRIYKKVDELKTPDMGEETPF